MAGIEFNRNTTAWQLQAAEARVGHKLISEPRGSLGEADQLSQYLASVCEIVDTYRQLVGSGGKFPVERIRDEVGPILLALSLHIATSNGVHAEDGLKSLLEGLSGSPDKTSVAGMYT